MSFFLSRPWRCAVLVTCLWHGGPVQALPLHPASDAEVVETLPAVVGERAEERRLRRELAARPGDAALAAAMARRRFAQAHETGDPRFAGQALAALQHWPDPVTAPDEVLLLQATVEQFLHAFERAASKLQTLLQRDPRHAQGWLTLATIRRVQGRLAESDAACASMHGLGIDLHARACRAENDGLRGSFDSARAALRLLLATPRLDAPTRNWLLTTLAELQARAGRPAEAEAAYRAAQAASRDGYTLLSHADFLLDLGRDAEALALLRGEPRNDAVLLRLAIAGTRLATPDGARDAGELRERIAQANQRPEAARLHAREQAMFALWVERQPQRALALARSNVALQREAIDLRLLVHAARASGDADAVRETARLIESTGVRDLRNAALR
jgi:predicted Zn-dependent protease